MAATAGLFPALLLALFADFEDVETLFDVAADVWPGFGGWEASLPCLEQYCYTIQGEYAPVNVNTEVAHSFCAQFFHA